MKKNIITIILTLLIFFNSLNTKAQYYTKSDTLQLPEKNYKYSVYSDKNKIITQTLGFTLIGVIVGPFVGKVIIGDPGELAGLAVFYYVSIGGTVGFLTGIGKSIIDWHNRKNFGYDKEGLMKHFDKENSFDNIILITYALASTGDKKVYHFLVDEYYNFSKAKFPPDNFIKSFQEVLAYAAVKNEYDLEPVLKSKLNLEDKQDILNKIPFCINVVPVDTAFYYLISEVEIQREEQYEKDIYLSDTYYEMLTAHLLTRRDEADFSELVEFYNSAPGGKVKFWLGFALADYKYEGSIDYLIEMYNTSGNGNFRFYALQGLMNFDTDKVREVMKKALYDDYIPPNQVKSNKEERFIIRNLAEEYLYN